MNFNPLYYPAIYDSPPRDWQPEFAEYWPFVQLIRSVLQPQVSLEISIGTAVGPEQYADGSIDLLQFDARRLLERGKQDFESWIPKISRQGVVLIYGIEKGEERWTELKVRFRHFELPVSNGLGLLVAWQVTAPELQEIFNASEMETKQFQAFFQALGKHSGQSLAYRELQSHHEQREREFAEITATLKQQNTQSTDAWRELQNQLSSITSGRGWQLLLWLWRVQRQFAPEHSFRRRLLQSVVRTAKSAASRLRSKDLTSSDNNQYNQWIAQNEPTEAELAQQKVTSEGFSFRPLISFVTPVYNTPPRLLNEMIQSVIEQTYSHWQLCLADGNPANEETRDLLLDWARTDERIKVKSLERNLGISGNSNAALALADGEFIAILDHDDLLAPFALYEVVKLLNEQLELDFIYSDRDLLSEDSRQRFEPHFKPGWSPETLLATNYLCHLCVIRKRLAEEAGGFNAATDGAQDWDFFLRVMERTNRFAHIPKILYHWRQWSNSAASGIAAKPYAFAAQRRAVREHLQRRGLLAETETLPGGFVRATWPVSGNNKVSFLVLSDGNLPRLKACLESVLKQTAYRNFEILIVCRPGKTGIPLDELQEFAPEIPLKLLTCERTASFPAAYNFAAQQATGELLLFFSAANQVVESGWLEEMVRWAEFPDVGIVGAKLLGTSGKVKHSGVTVNRGGLAEYLTEATVETAFGIFGSAECYRNRLAVAGDCLLVSKQFFQQQGGFEEDAADGDLTLCWKTHAGNRRVVYTPYALLKHSGALRHHFANPEQKQPDWLRQAGKNGDVFFNPNLSLVGRELKLTDNRGGNAI